MLIEYEKDAIRNLAILAHKQFKRNLDMTLDLPYFINEIIDLKDSGNEDFQGSNSLYNASYPRTIRVAPSIAEMYSSVMKINNEIIKVQKSDLSSDDKAKTQQDMIRDVIKPKQIIQLNEPLPIWWGDTLKGVNLRVGFVNNDRSKNYPFKLGGTQSHMLAGGNTGEGKSVVMNAMLTSLLTEYPPWELQLFMNDMKMLEYARYNMSDKCPQIRNIAITGSSTYLISVLKYMDTEMKLLYNLATMTGANSLQGMRNYLDLYIPRVICVTDEYSQLPENATSREQIQAEFFVQSIAKLGRAVGYHLILTTQNFKGALPNSTLGQFKVGVCVGANNDNSESIIGNDGAVALTKKVGYCLVNNNRAVGEKSNNVEYKVAFIDDKTSEQKQDFQNILKRVADTGKSLEIKDSPTSFNEKTQTDFSNFEEDFKSIQSKAQSIAAKKKLAPLVNCLLGDGTRYTGKSQTKEFFIWDFARSSNIMIHAMEKSEIKYLCHLIGWNFQQSKVNAAHRMIVDNMEIFEDDYMPNYKKDLTGSFNTATYLQTAIKRDLLLKYNLTAESNNKEISFEDYMIFVSQSDKNERLEAFFESLVTKNQQIDIDLLNKMFDSEDTEETFPEPYNSINSEKKEMVSNIIMEYNFYRKNEKLKKRKYITKTDFKPTVFWMFSPNLNEGVMRRGSITNEFLELVNIGPSVGIFFIIVLDNPKDLRSLILNCKHLVTGQVNPALSNTGLVEFSDTSGICCKYTQCQGEDDSCYYFKQYFRDFSEE